MHFPWCCMSYACVASIDTHPTTHETLRTVPSSTHTLHVFPAFLRTTVSHTHCAPLIALYTPPSHTLYSHTFHCIKSSAPVVVVVHNEPAVEDGEEAQQQSPVPVVSHPASIVALSRQIRQGIHGHILVVVQEHLQGNGWCGTHMGWLY